MWAVKTFKTATVIKGITVAVNKYNMLDLRICIHFFRYTVCIDIAMIS